MKILVVDDHALIREALRSVLAEVRSGATIVEAPDWRRAARLIEEHADLELVLLDLKLPDRDGFEALAALRERHPGISVVVLSAHDDRASVTKALNLGALGFIPKSATREVMLGALNLILAGGVYIPPEILEVVPATPSGRWPADNLRLTERQMAVLALMMKGKSNKAIARLLNLAEPTVKNHVTAVLKALKAANRTQAVIAAGAMGFEPTRAEE
jgi:DNA-binding NarL/FixJ family response regulator